MKKRILKKALASAMAVLMISGSTAALQPGIVSAAVADPSVSADAVLENTSALGADKIIKGESVTVKCSATGGSGSYRYAVYYKRASATKWTNAQKLGTNNKVVFTPKYTGEYQVCVHAKDSGGKLVKSYLSLMVYAPLTNTSKVSKSTILKGSTITLKGYSKGGIGERTYAFYYKRSASTGWTCAQAYSAASSITLTPKYVADYDVRINVKDERGNVVKKDLAFHVLPELKNNSRCSEKSVFKGTSVTLTGAAEGGSEGYKYAYYYKRNTSTKWTKAKGYSDTASVTITPKYAAEYTIRINVKDSMGHVIKKDIPLQVLSKLNNNSTLSASTILRGQTVTVMGAASGGAGDYQFAYYYKRTSTDTWSCAKSYSSDLTADITPLTSYDYDIRVKVKDHNGNIVNRDLTLEVLPALVNNSTVAKTTIIKGQSVTLNGSAKGGSGEYKFAYYYKRTTQNNWTTAKDYSDAQSVDITPKGAVDYDVMIRVKDSLGNVQEKQLSLSVLPSLENNSTVSASYINKGESVELQGNATGGSGDILFAFYYKRSTTDTWSCAQGYDANSRVSITPKYSGSYDVRVKAKDSSGNVVNKDLTIMVLAEMKNTSTVSTTSLYAGEAMKITPSATGGSEQYTYACFYYLNGAWTRISPYSDAAEITFTPESAAAYTLRVKAKDSLGTIVDKDFKVTVEKGLANVSQIEKTQIIKGSSVTLYGQANGGSGDYTYAYYYKQKSQKTWTLIKGFSTAVSASAAPKNAVDYDFRVDVKDSSGTVRSKYFEVKVNPELKNTTQIDETRYVVGQSVDITASATGGIGDYTYSFGYYSYDTDQTVMVIEDSTDPTATIVLPRTAGSYGLIVNIYDSEQNEAGAIYSIDVVDGMENTSSISSEVITAGGSFDIYGNAEGGVGPYEFAYYYRADNENGWRLIKDLSYDTYASLTPDEPGVYHILVKAKDQYSESSKTFRVTVTDVLECFADLDREFIYKGESFTVTAGAEGGTGDYTFAFYYKQASQNNWTTVKDFGTDTTAVITPRAAVKYEVRVAVKDSSGAVSDINTEVIVYNALTNNSTVSAEAVVVGDEVTLTGASSGGSGRRTYAYYYKQGSANTWSLLKDYSADTTAVFTAPETGFYDLMVRVMDEKGTVAEKTFTLNVVLPLMNASSIDKTLIVKGQTVNVTGAARGGSGSYTFAYYYKQSKSNTWTTVKDFSEDTEAVVKPAWDADYDIRVVAKDSLGSEQERIFTVTVLGKLVNSSTVSAESVLKGQTVTLDAAASGGSGQYSYRFFCKKSSDNEWTELNVSAASDIMACFTPTEAGDYDLRISVEDSLGAAEDKTFTLSVVPAFENTSTISKSVINSGERVTLTASASGQSSGYTYAFQTKGTAAAGWVTVQGYSETDTYTVSYSSAGTYELRVSIMDSLGNIENKDFTVTVYDVLSNDSSISSTSITSDSTAVVYASASGGNGSYTYAYYYRSATVSTWTTIKDFSSSTSAVFSPAGAGSYSVRVVAKDGRGSTADKVFSVTVTQALENTSTINTTSVVTGGGVELKASATGGTKPYSYAYYYKASFQNSWTCAVEYGNTNVLTMTLSSPGDYNFRVDVKDKTGRVSSKFFDVSVRNAIDNISYLESDTVKTGSAVVVHNAALGGSGTVKYSIYIRKANASQWATIATSTTASTTSYTLTAAGGYVLRSVATDSDGNTSEKTYNFEVLDTLFEESLDAVLADIITSNMDEFAKVKAIHDWMINYADYDTEGYNSGNIPDSSYTAEGFLETRRAVCDGYAKMFLALAQRAGLSAIRVTGTGVRDDGFSEAHAWNQVKVGGSWYNIDVTWDDPIVLGSTGDNLSYKYFLVPDSSFGSSHIAQSTKNSCTAAQPLDRLVALEINKDTTENQNWVYCETLAQVKSKMQSFYNQGQLSFTIIYKTTETDRSTVMSSIAEQRPSGTGLSMSIGNWKFDGYYRVSITLR